MLKCNKTVVSDANVQFVRLQNTTSQKRAFFIVTAMSTVHLKSFYLCCLVAWEDHRLTTRIHKLTTQETQTSYNEGVIEQGAYEDI